MTVLEVEAIFKKIMRRAATKATEFKNCRSANTNQFYIVF